jgi:hypothetical protein
MNNRDQEHRTECGCRKGVQEAAGAGTDFEFSKNPAAENRTDKTKENICQAAESAAPSDLSGEPAGNEAQEDPAEESAVDNDAENLVDEKQGCEQFGHTNSVIELAGIFEEKV